jgi:hypothetical protein
MIRMAKWFEPMKIIFITDLSTFGSKNDFDPKNCGFWKCAFNKKNVHAYVIENMNA